MNRRCRESQPVPRFSSQANVWAGYDLGLFSSQEIDENGHFCPKELLSKTMLPFQRQPPAMSVTNPNAQHSPFPSFDAPPSPVLPPVLPPVPPPVPPPMLPPPVLPPPVLPPPILPPSGLTIGELALVAEVRMLEKQVRDLTLDKKHTERLLHALVDYHAYAYLKEKGQERNK